MADLACPSCGSARVVPIVYGEPAEADVFERAQRGEIVIGGCLIDEDNPTRECRACGHRFGRLGDEHPGLFEALIERVERRRDGGAGDEGLARLLVQDEEAGELDDSDAWDVDEDGNLIYDTRLPQAEWYPPRIDADGLVDIAEDLDVEDAPRRHSTFVIPLPAPKPKGKP